MAEEQVSGALQQAVRAAAALGQNDLAFHRSLDAEFSASLSNCLQRLLGITSSLLNYVSEGDAPRLRSEDDVNSKWGDVIDVVDSLLERTDASLEELTAKARKEKEDAAIQQAAKKEKPPLPASLRNAQDLPHPQLKFTQKPDNGDDEWTPRLTHKANAKLSLEESLVRSRDVDGVQRIGHPYAYEIETLEYPEFVFVEQEPIKYHDVDETAATWVDTEEKLQAMLDELKKSQEIAIDLEHHDFHSFRGFVCLMQISDRNQDWIVDTLALREELIVLNEVFTDPTILKVLHGANSDIIWLQRDFGLYIVNMFDTYHASKVLGLEGHGLAYLLQKYVNFDADKRYQLADWRIRPLPKEMLYYARSDTHYLLYIYDLMRNELLQKCDPGTHNVIASVLQASADVSLRQYVKEPYDAAEGQGSDGWQYLLNRFYGTRAFGPQQLEVLKALHQWRDQKAKELDESTRFTMPNQAIITIAASMPRDTDALVAQCKPISGTMRAHLKELVSVVESAIAHADANASASANATELNETQVPAVSYILDDTEPAQAMDHAETHEQISAEHLLKSHSEFWGNMASGINARHFESPLQDLRLSVPLPALADEVYESATTAPKAPTPPPVAQPDKTEAEVFVVRDVGKQQAAKRKSESLDLTNGSGTFPASSDTRQSRKRSKTKVKGTTSPDTPTEDAASKPPVAAFDYAAQPSLLKEKEFKKQKGKKFGEFQGKIVRSKQVQGGKQSTFKR